MEKFASVMDAAFSTLPPVPDIIRENMEEVSLCDRLSNQVYYYDRNSKELSLATDTPNKRLDQNAA